MMRRVRRTWAKPPFPRDATRRRTANLDVTQALIRSCPRKRASSAESQLDPRFRGDERFVFWRLRHGLDDPAELVEDLVDLRFRHDQRRRQSEGVADRAHG